jgi:hypothetical protein
MSEVERRKSYYAENREKILEKNKAYYHARKNIPAYYDKVKERNQTSYRNRTKRVYTEEDRLLDEKQMVDIMSWIKRNRELYGEVPHPDRKNKKEMTEYLSLFYD